jgi:hypothetical protein
MDPLPFLKEALKVVGEGKPLPSLLKPGHSVDPKFVAEA